MPGVFMLPLAAAGPIPVSNAAYLAEWATHATPLVCDCGADQLQLPTDGRRMLELATATAAAASQTTAETTAAVAALRSRYGIAPGAPLGPQLDAVMLQSAAVCEPKKVTQGDKQ